MTRGRQRPVRTAVTGVGGGVGQAIVRSLRSWPGCSHCIGFDMRPDSVGFFFCDKGFVVPRAGEEGYYEALLEHCIEEGIEVLIPGSDPELLPLAQAKESMGEHGIHVLVSSPEAVRVARSKVDTARSFAANGAPFAQTVPIRSARELAASVGFPLLVKPNDGSATRDVHIVFSDDELEGHLNRKGAIAQEYLVPTAWERQRADFRREDAYHEGVIRQQDELSIQFLIGRNGEELGVFASRNRLMNGVPMVIEPEPMPDVIEAARPAICALVRLGLVGPCNLQGRKTESGVVFFEVNPRFTGITAMRTAMGFREIEATIRDLLWDETADNLAPILQQPDDVACLRYVTEEIVPTEELRRHRQSARQADG